MSFEQKTQRAGGMSTEKVETFRERGYIGPVRVISKQQCSRVFAGLSRDSAVRRMDWNKSRGALSRVYFELATLPAIVDVVSELLGGDAMLWGASIQSRAPGEVHPWHSDIESALHSDSTVSVWLGLSGISRQSSLQLIPGSHRFGLSIQEERARRGCKRDQVHGDQVEAWAGERDPSSGLVVPDMGDGEALYFDGQLWHGSHNLSRKSRHALLLQYALPRTEIRIPDFNSLDWPFTYLDLPWPPCVMVRGSGDGKKNRFTLPPVAGRNASMGQLTSRSHRLGIPLATDVETGWKPYPLFNGTTANHEALSCHVSSLRVGSIPHPPHRHKEEELLLLQDGEADLLLPDLDPSGAEHRVRLRPGEFVYYPAQFAHTLQAVGDTPANYLMFKWYSEPISGSEELGYRFNPSIESTATESVTGFKTRLLFEGPTGCLRKLHAHASMLAPGAGYDAHIDAHDVAIIVYTGEIETQGSRYGPHSVIYFPAGEVHGMSNPGTDPATYLVFEFHGSNGALTSLRRSPPRSLLRRVTSLKSWKRLMHRVRPRLRG